MTDPVSPGRNHSGHAGRAELWAGTIVLAVAATLFFMWYTDRSGHGERAFLLFPVAFVAPLGLGAIASGLVARYQWPWRQRRVFGTLLVAAGALVAIWVWHV